MRTARWLALVAACFISACATTPAPSAKSPADEQARVQARVQDLLNKYASNDQAGITALLDPQFLMLGSQINEKITTPDQLKSLMTSDFSQWRTARISSIRDMDVRVGSDLATAYFLMSFQAGENPSIPIRVTTTWHKRSGEWYLTQSANSVMMGN